MNKRQRLQSLVSASQGLTSPAAASQPAIRVHYYDDFEAAVSSEAQVSSSILVIANADYLMLLPCFAETQGIVSRVRDLSRDMAVFSKRELDWQVDIRLKMNFEHALLLAAEELNNRETGCAFTYLFINGGFEKRFFPEVLQEFQNTEQLNINRTYAGRLFNPKTQVIARSFGPQSLANLLIHFDRAGTMCSCFDNYLDVIGVGRGNSRQKLLLGAIYEYLERRISGELPHNLRWASTSEALSHQSEQRQILPPYALYGCNESDSELFFPGWQPQKSIAWMPGKTLLDNQDIWLPAAMVCYLDSTLEKMSYNTNSNGCALGNSPLEAAYYALLEIIERDAILLTWYTRSAPVRIRLDDSISLNIQAMSQMLECEGYQLHLFHISTDIDVPVVLAVLEGQQANKMARFITAGAHTDPLLALENAVAEAWSLHAICESNYLKKGTQERRQGRENTEQYFEYANPENQAHFDFILNSGKQLTAADYLATYGQHQQSEEPLSYLLSKVKAAGYRPLYVENTPGYLKDMGLHWVRVYVPELINLVFGRKPVYVSPSRVAKAASQKDWLNNVPVDTHPVLHPLG